MQRLIVCGISLTLLALAAFAPTAQETTCRVSIELIDGNTNQPVSGLVRIAEADGGVLHPDELQSRGVGLPAEQVIHEWSVVPGGKAELKLSAQKLSFAAISGLETERAEVTLDLAGKKTADLKLVLKPFSNLRMQGQIAGNTHLHLMKLARDDSDRYLREIPRADGLDVLFVSYLERADADHEYISNKYTKDDLANLSADNLPIGNGEEHRHNFGPGDEGYGHVMFLDLPGLVLPVSLGPGITKRGNDGIPLQRGIDQARKAGATVVWCHNNWGRENIPSWVTKRLDAQNIFDGGEHGSYEDSFYRYLNAGIHVPFSTGTDWFIYDFSRVYVPVEGEITPQAWLKSLRAGRSFITNGPLLEFTANEKQPGDVIDLKEPGEIEVTAKATGRIDFGSLELIQNGRVVRSQPSRAVDGHFEAALEVKLPVHDPGWIAVRTPPPPLDKAPDRFPPVNRNEFGQLLFSHSSPVYVSIAGREMFDAQIAKEFLSEIERNRREIAESGQFADDEERGRVLAVHDQAVETLKSWLDRHNR